MNSAAIHHKAGASGLPSCCGRRFPAAHGRVACPLMAGRGRSMQQRRFLTSTAAKPSQQQGSSSSDSVEAAAADSLRHGNGLARQMLSDPDLEGDPLSFLKATEAYWKALKNQKHEPHKKGPTVISTSSSSFSTLMPQPNSSRNSSSSTSNHSSTYVKHSPSFGVAPTAAAAAAAPPSAAAAAGTGSLTSSSSSNSSSQAHDFDVIMCGGTLGIMLALALQQQGLRVAVVEKRRVEGRTQEWNTSWHECKVLVDMGLMSEAELQSTIVSEFNPVRVGFKGGEPLWVNDCLNLGLRPKTLIAILRSKFEALGGVVYEHTAFKSAVVCPDGVVVTVAEAADAPPGVGDTNRPNALGKEEQQQQVLALQLQHLQVVPAGNPSRIVQNGAANSADGHHSNTGGSSSNGRSSSSSNGHNAAAAAAAGGGVGSGFGVRRAPPKLSGRLVLDCMGHYSNIVKQIRGRAKPEGMVLVVGGCATGIPQESNRTADLLYTITDASTDMQLFWEAFPAEGGTARTTYMFAYSDAHPSRPSFEQLLDTYFTLLPAYQHLPQGLQGLKFKRVLFGGFPCYSDAPLKPGFDRVLQLGDASASQSPLSFGGFGSMLRHLERLVAGISHALRDDKLCQGELSWIHPYQPSLSAAWLFQRSMSVGVGQLLQQQQQCDGHAAGRSAAVNLTSAQPATAGAHVGETAETVPAAAGVGQGLAASAGANGHSYGASLLHSSNDVHDSSGSHNMFDRWVVHGSTMFSSSNGNGHDSSSNPLSSSSGHDSNGVNAVRNTAASSTATALDGVAASNGSRGAVAVTSSRNSSSSSKSDAASSTKASSSTSSSSSAKGCPAWLQRLLLLPANHINALLGVNFTVMSVLGLRVMKPFLQDTLQLGPLAGTMLGMMLVKPLVITRVLGQVGAKVLLGWFGHFAMLTAYTLGHWLLAPLRGLTSSYTLHRLLDALKYGSSSDYTYHASPPVTKDQAAQANRQASGTAAAAGSGVGNQGVRERQGVGHIVPMQWGNGNVRSQQQQQHDGDGAVDVAAAAAAAASGAGA